jgi:ABC-type Na+ efflux pump permease subunit
MFETTYLRTRGPMYFVETTQIVPTNKSTFTVTVMQFIVIFFSFFFFFWGGGGVGSSIA